MSSMCLTIGRLFFRDAHGPTIIVIQEGERLEVDMALNVYINGELQEGVWASGIASTPKKGEV